MEKNYSSVFSNPAGLSDVELKQFRAKLSIIGSALFGKRLCIPISDNLDLNYGRKEKGEIAGLRLSSPMKKYMIESVDITGAQVVRTANEKIVIMFNDREDLQFPITADITDIVKAEPKDVHAAIKLFEATGEKTFFCNVQMVTDTVTNLNKANIKDIEKLIDELAEQEGSLETLNAVIESDTKDYYKSLGQE